MPEDHHVQAYLKLCWVLTTSHSLLNPATTRAHYERFAKKYARFLTRLIDTLKLLLTNLVISLNYLHRYSLLNAVHLLRLEDDCSDAGASISMVCYAIVTSLILLNKNYNDQSYTLKTWYNISHDQLGFKNMSLALLNQLEQHFLLVVNYLLNFNNISNKHDRFWDQLTRQLALYHPYLMSCSGYIVQFQKHVSADAAGAPAGVLSPRSARKMLTPVSKLAKMSAVPAPSLPIGSSVFKPGFLIPTPLISTLSSPNYCATNFYTSASPLTPITPYNKHLNNSVKRRKPDLPLAPAPFQPLLAYCQPAPLQEQFDLWKTPFYTQ